MTSYLPINIDDLLRFRGVESQRVELKADWNEGPTAEQVLRNICAFANDFYNVNGGYLVIGVEEQDGAAALPPRGLTTKVIERAQRWIRGNCKGRLDPEYQPLLSPEVVDGKHILVLWVPGGDVRPYKLRGKGTPETYYIRQGNETVAAQGQPLADLLAMTAKVPFDERRAMTRTLNDLRAALVREFLHDIRSRLLEEKDDAEVYRRMRLSVRVNGHEVPRNVALLFFSDDPEQSFPGARIEVVQFADGAGGNTIEERIFRGPLTRQLRDCLDHLRNLSTGHVRKEPARAEAEGWVSFPYPALEETVVNAVYHRSYEGPAEPTKVYLYPDRIEITSYPGPVPGLSPEHFLPGRRIPQVPARNKRIGELLKEIRLAEGRGTGVPKVFRAMEENGSPPPRFEFDEGRTYFTVVLAAHPGYVIRTALREAALMKATGDGDGSLRRLQEAFQTAPGIGVLAKALIDELGARGDRAGVLATYEQFYRQPQRSQEADVTTALLHTGALAGAGDAIFARVDDLLTRSKVLSDATAAVLDQEDVAAAHQAFERHRDSVMTSWIPLWAFAESKLRLAENLSASTDSYDQEARRQLLRDARALFERTLSMDAEPILLAIAWSRLARVLSALGMPEQEVQHALREAERAERDSAAFGKG